MKWILHGLAAAAMALAAALPQGAQARTGEVALTFDDLPGLTVFNDQPWTNDINARLVHGLRRNHLKAIGFVNEGKFDQGVRAQQIADVAAWVAAGFDLGNHTFSHDSPNQVGAAAYIADIAKGEPVTRRLLAQHHKRLMWFRHPYLETGSPAAVKREIDTWLAEHGYRVAPVTIDANDWEFAEPYEYALAQKNTARAEAIRREYLDYTDRTIGWFQEASTSLFGRQIAFVMLLHDTRLNADSIDALAGILKRRKLRSVSLGQAMRDRAYRLPDTYAGRDGIDWMERWSDQLHRPLPWNDWEDVPADVVSAYDQTNNDRR